MKTAFQGIARDIKSRAFQNTYLREDQREGVVRREKAIRGDQSEGSEGGRECHATVVGADTRRGHWTRDLDNLASKKIGGGLQRVSGDRDKDSVSSEACGEEEGRGVTGRRRKLSVSGAEEAL